MKETILSSTVAKFKLSMFLFVVVFCFLLANLFYWWNFLITSPVNINHCVGKGVADADPSHSLTVSM